MCRNCQKEWLPAIEHHRKKYFFKKGELLCQEGAKAEGVFFVYTGTVKVHKKWGKDKELIVRFARKGDIVGHRGLGKSLVFPISATALEPVTACYIDLDFLLTTLKVNDAFLFQLMMFFAEELEESEKKMRNLAHMTVKGRVALALATLKEKFGVDKNGALNILLNRQDIASFAGTTYETVIRLINEFVTEDAIEIAGKNIIIKSTKKLLSYTRQNDGALEHL